jgi:hypothetical protein
MTGIRRARRHWAVAAAPGRGGGAGPWRHWVETFAQAAATAGA